MVGKNNLEIICLPAKGVKLHGIWVEVGKDVSSIGLPSVPNIHRPHTLHPGMRHFTVSILNKLCTTTVLNRVENFHTSFARLLQLGALSIVEVPRRPLHHIVELRKVPPGREQVEFLRLPSKVTFPNLPPGQGYASPS